MIQSFTIPHTLPSYNEYVGRASRWNYTKLKKDIQQSIQIEIKRAKLKPMPYAYLSFTWYEPNKRRNKDNVMSAQKFCIDALVNMKILKNDGWSEVLGLHHEFVCLESKAGKVMVTLSTEGH